MEFKPQQIIDKLKSGELKFNFKGENTITLETKNNSITNVGLITQHNNNSDTKINIIEQWVDEGLGVAFIELQISSIYGDVYNSLTKEQFINEIINKTTEIKNFFVDTNTHYNISVTYKISHNIIVYLAESYGVSAEDINIHYNNDEGIGIFLYENYTDDVINAIYNGVINKLNLQISLR